MDIDFLCALASIENNDDHFCVLKKESKVYLHTDLDKTYDNILKVPDDSYVTGHQNYDSAKGQWSTWKKVRSFDKNDFSSFDEIEIKDKSRRYQWQTNIDKSKYIEISKKMIDDMSRGEYFLANLTRKLKIDQKIDPIKIAIQSTFDHDCEFRYFYFSPDYSYLSLSPENFITVKDDKIISSPIKGTAKTYDELFINEKDREENTMIVDLVRADFSKISKPESIKVQEFQNITSHPGLVQMNSSITATLEQNIDLRKSISELMPIASVSGTPKPRVIKVISEYENVERGIYCGAIGWVDLHKNECELSVAIRGIEFRDNSISIGVGSGITVRSDPTKEFEETELKASRLIQIVEDNSVLETNSIFTSIYVTNKQELFALDQHINRLKEAGNSIDVNISEKEIRDKIIQFIFNNLTGEGKLTISINKEGVITITFDKSSDSVNHFKKIGISIGTKFSGQVYVIKSQPRNNYLELFRQGQYCAQYEIDESLIVINQKVTESTRANVFVRYGNIVITPKFNDNFLNGIFRQTIISQFDNSDLELIEKDINISELSEADEIILVNSVRGSSLITNIDSIIFPELKHYEPKLPVLKNYLDSIFINNLQKISEDV